MVRFYFIEILWDFFDFFIDVVFFKFKWLGNEEVINKWKEKKRVFLLGFVCGVFYIDIEF